MGQRLLWTGLTVIEASAVVKIQPAQIVGGIIMVIGCIVMWIEASRSG